MVRQQLVDAAVGVAGKPFEHVTQVAHGSCPLSLADCTRLMTIAARWPGQLAAAEEPCAAPHCPWFYLALEEVVIDRNGPVLEVARQRSPAVQAVVDRAGDRAAVRHAAALELQPDAQLLRYEIRVPSNFRAAYGNRS